MKSLTTINEILHKWPEIKDSTASLFESETKFPVHISGIQGSLFTFYTSEICQQNHFKAISAQQYSASSRSAPEYALYSSDLFIVTPTDQDAALNNDISCCDSAKNNWNHKESTRF